mmetsp:Transcript_4274/g.6332  ORF Transcript_4274/g.6332 Transcript_4274/m.6332 type:complete len:221 (+) Transcript_4274:127-789(+)
MQELTVLFFSINQTYVYNIIRVPFLLFCQNFVRNKVCHLQKSSRSSRIRCSSPGLKAGNPRYGHPAHRNASPLEQFPHAELSTFTCCCNCSSSARPQVQLSHGFRPQSSSDFLLIADILGGASKSPPPSSSRSSSSSIISSSRSVIVTLLLTWILLVSAWLGRCLFGIAINVLHALSRFSLCKTSPERRNAFVILATTLESTPPSSDRTETLQSPEVRFK